MANLGSKLIVDATTRRAASVDVHRRILVNYKTDLQFALDNGDAYSWHASSIEFGSGATELLTVQNLSATRLLHITKVIVTNSDSLVGSAFSLHLPGTSTPTAGVAVTGKPMNTAKTKVAGALAFEDDQTAGNALLAGNVIASKSVRFERSETIQNADGSDLCVLGKNRCITLHVVEDIGLASCEIFGYYRTPAAGG